MTNDADDAEAMALEDALDDLRRGRSGNLGHDAIAELVQAVRYATNALELKQPPWRDDRRATT